MTDVENTQITKILHNKSLTTAQKHDLINLVIAQYSINAIIFPAICATLIGGIGVRVGYGHYTFKKHQQIEREKYQRRCDRQRKAMEDLYAPKPPEPEDPFVALKRKTLAIPLDDRAVSFFTSRPMHISDTEDVTVMVRYQAVVVTASRDEAASIKNGKTPLVRSLIVDGVNRPWYQWGGYKPFSNYWDAVSQSWVWVNSRVKAGWMPVEEIDPELPGYIDQTKAVPIEWQDVTKQQYGALYRWLTEKRLLFKALNPTLSAAYRPAHAQGKRTGVHCALAVLGLEEAHSSSGLRKQRPSGGAYAGEKSITPQVRIHRANKNEEKLRRGLLKKSVNMTTLSHPLVKQAVQEQKTHAESEDAKKPAHKVLPPPLNAPPANAKAAEHPKAPESSRRRSRRSALKNSKWDLQRPAGADSTWDEAPVPTGPQEPTPFPVAWAEQIKALHRQIEEMITKAAIDIHDVDHLDYPEKVKPHDDIESEPLQPDSTIFAQLDDEGNLVSVSPIANQYPPVTSQDSLDSAQPEEIASDQMTRVDIPAADAPAELEFLAHGPSEAEPETVAVAADQTIAMQAPMLDEFVAEDSEHEEHSKTVGERLVEHDHRPVKWRVKRHAQDDSESLHAEPPKTVDTPYDPLAPDLPDETPSLPIQETVSSTPEAASTIEPSAPQAAKPAVEKEVRASRPLRKAVKKSTTTVIREVIAGGPGAMAAPYATAGSYGGDPHVVAPAVSRRSDWSLRNRQTGSGAPQPPQIAFQPSQHVPPPAISPAPVQSAAPQAVFGPAQYPQTGSPELPREHRRPPVSFSRDESPHRTAPYIPPTARPERNSVRRSSSQRPRLVRNAPGESRVVGSRRKQKLEPGQVVERAAIAAGTPNGGVASHIHPDLASQLASNPALLGDLNELIGKLLQNYVADASAGSAGLANEIQQGEPAELAEQTV